MALRLRSIASVMSLGFLITLTSAQQPTDPQEPPVASGVDIFNYGEVDKTCMRWTDGCRNCSRGVLLATGALASYSTPHNKQPRWPVGVLANHPT